METSLNLHKYYYVDLMQVNYGKDLVRLNLSLEGHQSIGLFQIFSFLNSEGVYSKLIDD